MGQSLAVRTCFEHSARNTLEASAMQFETQTLGHGGPACQGFCVRWKASAAYPDLAGLSSTRVLRTDHYTGKQGL